MVRASSFRPLLVAVALFVVGCGGSGGGGSTIPSPFAGTWSGTWDSPNTGEDGTATVTIASNGNVNGTIFNTQSGDNGTVTGQINNNGNVSGSAQYPGGPVINLSGTWAINGSGHLVGNLTQTVGSNSTPASFDLLRN